MDRFVKKVYRSEYTALFLLFSLNFHSLAVLPFLVFLIDLFLSFCFYTCCFGAQFIIFEDLFLYFLVLELEGFVILVECRRELGFELF